MTPLIFLGDVFIRTVKGKEYSSVRESDMPVWLQYPGVIGLMDSDTFEEIECSTKAGLDFEPVTPNGARLVLATLADGPMPGLLNIATSNPNSARRLLTERGYTFDISMVLGGSVETAPRLPGRCNAIVDIVQTGNTLADNGLVIVDELEMVQFGVVSQRPQTVPVNG